MNTLGRDIQAGEIVVIGAEYTDRKDRRFRCEGGFGMLASTMGTALMGVWHIDPEESARTRLEGDMIDRQATERLQHAIR
jgi:hypothetical protein